LTECFLRTEKYFGGIRIKRVDPSFKKYLGLFGQKYEFSSICGKRKDLPDHERIQNYVFSRSIFIFQTTQKIFLSG
jgi:hypothetical protein